MLAVGVLGIGGSLVSNDERGLKQACAPHHSGRSGGSLVSNDERGLKPFAAWFLTAARWVRSLAMTSVD